MSPIFRRPGRPARSAVPPAGVLRRERRALLQFREERLRDLGGLLLEMFRRDRFREDLIRERYRGIRPAAGYPACPDHTEKWLLFELLDVERNTGITLTESGAMYPGSSVSGLYFAHPRAQYFGVGRIDRDQVQDYSRRKGMDPATVERWLAPNLAYEPEG